MQGNSFLVDRWPFVCHPVSFGVPYGLVLWLLPVNGLFAVSSSLGAAGQAVPVLVAHSQGVQGWAALAVAAEVCLIGGRSHLGKMVGTPRFIEVE